MNPSITPLLVSYKNIPLADTFLPEKNWGFGFVLPKQPLKVKGTESRYRVAIAASENFWYFLTEILRIKTSRGLVHVKVNGTSLHFAWAAMANANARILNLHGAQPEILIAAYTVWLKIKPGYNYTSLSTMANSREERTKINKYIKSFYETLPDWMKFDTSVQNHVWVSQANRDAASNLGRGLTSSVSFYTDIGNFKHLDIVLPTNKAAAVAAKNNALENNLPSFSIYFDTKLNSKASKYVCSTYLAESKYLYRLFSIDPTKIDQYQFGQNVILA